jgi:hypothetical protein
VEPCKEDYKNIPSRDWLDCSHAFREKEASLLLSQRERIDNHFFQLGRGQGETLVAVLEVKISRSWLLLDLYLVLLEELY